MFYSFLSNCLYLMKRVSGQSLVMGQDSRWTRNEGGNPGIQFQMLYNLSQSVEPPLAGPKVLWVPHYFHITLLRFHSRISPKPGEPFLSEWLVSSLRHGLIGLRVFHLRVRVNSHWAQFALCILLSWFSLSCGPHGVFHTQLSGKKVDCLASQQRDLGTGLDLPAANYLLSDSHLEVGLRRWLF